MKKGDRITLEADTSDDQEAVYDILDEIKKTIPLNMYNLTQAELVARMAFNDDKPETVVTIRLTYPNSCSLKYDEIGLKLRGMLEASGIELREPQEGTDLSKRDEM